MRKPVIIGGKMRESCQRGKKARNVHRIAHIRIDGGKTGSTQRAGDCLITTARKPDRFVPVNATQKRRIPYRLVTVVLASPDRFGQTAGLIQQGWTNYDAWVAGGMQVTQGEILTIAN